MKDIEMNSINEMNNTLNSVLNIGDEICIVFDAVSLKVLYQNAKATGLYGDASNKTASFFVGEDSIDSIMEQIKYFGSATVDIDIDDMVYDKAEWNIYKIQWFDGRDALLMRLKKLYLDGDGKLSVAPNNICGGDRIDSLTGIPTINQFYFKVSKMLAKSNDIQYAMVVFDVDKFKSINDLFGMTDGDKVLKKIASVIEKVIDGENQYYARMHSDLFVFITNFEKKGEIIRQIERIRKELDDNTFEYSINTSYGIYIIDDKMVPINLMCDRAMVASRSTKGNVIKFCAFYDEQYRDDMIRTSEIEGSMIKALRNGEFKMYLQPKYNLDSYKLCGAEALARWEHPQKGIITPIEFIPLFEKNGFILNLDEYIWEEACRTIREWIDEGRKPVPISVNISRYHIDHSNLVEVLTGLIHKYDILPAYLGLEITESLFLEKPENLNRVLVQLRELGFNLEVDDFGSGFSSLNLIRNIAVDTIKIDKDFLDSEIATKKGKIVVNHTISMAKDLELKVIAEGVETEEHVNFLKNSNCDMAQGFFFAKPMPINEFNKFNF